MKIAYVYPTMARAGGTERMITEKVNILSEHFGYDITIITCFQPANERNYFDIYKKVKQIYLEIPYFSQYKYKYPKRLWIKWKMNRILKKSIIQAVIEEDPDILIGFSRFKANYISSVKCRAKKIIECHETRYNTNYDASEEHSVLVRMYMEIYRRFYFRVVEQRADIVVTLTEKDKQLWKRAKRIEVIPNFSTIQISNFCDCTSKRVIAVGRLAWEKGFGRLIEAWGIVSSRHPDWHLDIFGEGRMYDTLMALIKLYKAKNITIHENTATISQEYAKSSICTVTSYFEGFSLVLLEAIRHGLPCIAFDCPFGPGYIIDDAREGFLVENGDIRLFAERLCRLIEDVELRKLFSGNAIKRAKYFDANVIMNQWKALFESLF
jgi:glycosyltransferase involved in cell wall biosynthesis